MSKPSVVIVGSGAGASVAAFVLAHAGHPVTILEKGRNLLPGLGGKGPVGSLFSNDEVKAARFFENPDPLLEPRTARTQDEAANGVDRSFVGDVNGLPTVVGGGTIHWDAKTPRFWKQDFKGRSLYGPVPEANVADWPLTYEDLAPFYDAVEERLGVQGDVDQIPPHVLSQAPRDRQFTLPPNPPMYGSTVLAEGARKLGYHPYPVAMAVHSRPFGGHARCNSCGLCSGFGCPINARGGAAISFLHDALRAGARLKSRCFAQRVDLAPDGRRATGVSYLDAQGRPRTQRGDLVILAPSAIETARLLLLSATSDHPHGVGNRSGQLGRNLMFHFFTLGFAHFARDMHAWRGPSTTITIDDFVGPDSPPAAKQAGLPYIKGGICETGATLMLRDEASVYAAAPNAWGKAHKDLMRASPLRARLVGLAMVGEDMPQEANRVDLDPQVRDVYGFPVARITRTPHRFEQVASEYYGPKIADICRSAPGAIDGIYLPIASLVAATGGEGSVFNAGPAATAHIMGTARMGTDPSRSVTDAFGRVHEVDNLFLGDGSVFVSAGGFNPTLTIMALAMRMATHAGALPAPHPHRSRRRHHHAEHHRDREPDHDRDDRARHQAR
jgi:choline dehydrogenase-like flavoprotein